MNLDALIAPLRADVVSGAATIGRTAAEVVRRAARQVPGESAEAVREGVAELVVRILDAQPAMAPLVSLAVDVLRAVEAAEDGPAARSAVLRAAGAFRDRIDTAAGAVARHAGSLLRGNETVLTLSASGTVRTALEEVAKSGAGLHVICLEGRPMSEGQNLARRLGSRGIRVLLAVDAAAGALLPEADVVLLGADSVGDAGVVNKIGSLAVATLARDRRIPVHVLADRSKLLPPGFPQPTDDDRPEREVCPPPPGVRIWNRYFEVVPASLVTGFVTEEGPLRGEELERRRRSLPVPADLRAWAEGQPTAEPRIR